MAQPAGCAGASRPIAACGLYPTLCTVRLQVRHNEDKLNTELSRSVRWPVDAALCDLPHTKANLLFQAHLGRLPLPLSDYVTDTKLALDNAIRLLQAMIDVVASQGFLHSTIACIHTLQVPPTPPPPSFPPEHACPCHMQGLKPMPAALCGLVQPLQR